MTARERVVKTLRGEPADRVPFTLYEGFAGFCTNLEHHLRRGMGIVHRVRSARIETTGVDIKSTETAENGRRLIRTDYRTPAGDVYTLKEAGDGTTWTHEHLFKTPEDYPAIRYILGHRKAEPDYLRVARIAEELDERYILRDGLMLEPLQELISSDIMDCITFSLQWCENRDMIEALYRENVRFHEQLYEIIAAGPLLHCNYGGNVIPQIIGPDVFRQYYVPHYNAAADVFHHYGKLIGTHLDGDNRPIMDLIRETDLDYIEAYDPSLSPPMDTARRALCGKALWINWPSGMHYRPDADIPEITADLVSDYGPGGRLLFAVTEDLPSGRWDAIIEGILDGLGYPDAGR